MRFRRELSPEDEVVEQSRMFARRQRQHQTDVVVVVVGAEIRRLRSVAMATGVDVRVTFPEGTAGVRVKHVTPTRHMVTLTRHVTLTPRQAAFVGCFRLDLVTVVVFCFELLVSGVRPIIPLPVLLVPAVRSPERQSARPRPGHPAFQFPLDTSKCVAAAAVFAAERRSVLDRPPSSVLGRFQESSMRRMVVLSTGKSAGRSRWRIRS